MEGVIEKAESNLFTTKCMFNGRNFVALRTHENETAAKGQKNLVMVSVQY